MPLDLLVTIYQTLHGIEDRYPKDSLFPIMLLAYSDRLICFGLPKLKQFHVVRPKRWGASVAALALWNEKLLEILMASTLPIFRPSFKKTDFTQGPCVKWVGRFWEC